MYQFNYHKPASLDEAASLMAGAEDGTYLSGGMTLIPTLKQRLAAPSDVIDLGAIESLSGIIDNGNTITVGRHDPPRRSRGKRRDSRLGRPRRPHRRRPRSQPRHHRRLHRQQRPGSRLPRGSRRLGQHHPHHQAVDSGWRVLPGPLRNRSRGRRNHHLGGVHQTHRRRIREVPQPSLPLRRPSASS